MLIKKVIFLAEYLNYTNIFSKKPVIELFKWADSNKYLIDLKLDKQPLYGLIYSLRPMWLEILKTYIQINLVNDFIRLSKSLARTLILFNWKLDYSFCQFVNYQGSNNLTITNWYPLSLISELIDQVRLSSWVHSKQTSLKKDQGEQKLEVNIQHMI